MSLQLHTDQPLAVAVVEAIRTGDVAELKRLLAEHSGLATARICCDDKPGSARTLLHIATDWPGGFPNGPAVIAALVEAGADVNARFVGGHEETPLHWAASSNDVAAIDALLDAGADIEAAGAVIGGGPPLADARGFGQWNAARRLLERGARPSLNDAATLGLLDRVEAYIAAHGPTADEITRAFWAACHGGQQRVAAWLLNRGADLNWIGYGGMTPLDVARRDDAAALAGPVAAAQLVDWLLARGAKSAGELSSSRRA
jgi:uncharacterized protein